MFYPITPEMVMHLYYPLIKRFHSTHAFISSDWSMIYRRGMKSHGIAMYYPIGDVCRLVFAKRRRCENELSCPDLCLPIKKIIK